MPVLVIHAIPDVMPLEVNPSGLETPILQFVDNIWVV